MTREQLMAEIIAKYEKLVINLIIGYYTPTPKTVDSLQDEILDLTQQLETAEVAEIKSTPIPSGWICPRCQKVHNWMVQSCDCYPSVITASTTEPIPENYLNDCIEKATPNLSKIKDVDKELAEISGMASCNSCRHQDTCNIDSDNVCKYDTKEQAEKHLCEYTSRLMRRAFKYAKVVKAPYTPCKGGQGWCH